MARRRGKLVLRVGTSGDYAPFSSAGEGRSPSGFDIAVARAYAQERGLGLEFVSFRWPDLVRDLAGRPLRRRDERRHDPAAALARGTLQRAGRRERRGAAAATARALERRGGAGSSRSAHRRERGRLPRAGGPGALPARHAALDRRQRGRARGAARGRARRCRDATASRRRSGGAAPKSSGRRPPSPAIARPTSCGPIVPRSRPTSTAGCSIARPTAASTSCAASTSARPRRRPSRRPSARSSRRWTSGSH